MNKEEIQAWVKVNNYLLVDLKNRHASIEEVFEIAEKSVGIEPGGVYKKTQRPEYSFSRFLAINYLIRYYAIGVLADILSAHHSIGHYTSKNMNDDIKYYKGWQQNAILYFNEKISEIDNGLKKS